MSVEPITIPALRIKTLTVRIVGDSPLVQHNWSEKQKKQIRDKQAKKATTGREKRNPKAEYEAGFYKYPGGGYGHPSVAFKAAMVRAAKGLGMPMTDARVAFHLPGELVKIIGKPKMREDMVRVSNGAADIRYRPEFTKWSADIMVRYNEAMVSAEQIVNLINAAGFGTGIGENRAERGGNWGMFHVDSHKELAA